MTRVILDGLTPTEIGYELGTSRRWVSQQIAELRAEIERLN
jgi:biotin operon repressor